jgi:hypothetical protein
MKKPVSEKERKVFVLTQEGKQRRIGLFKRFVELVSITIEPSLHVCAHCDCKVYEGTYREVIDGKERVLLHAMHSVIQINSGPR